MVAQYISCPLCGLEFERDDTLCVHGCPLGALCNMLRCPSCEYEFPLKPRRVSWMRRLWGRDTRSQPELPEKILMIGDLAVGEAAVVMCVGGGASARRNTLAVFGMVPGVEVTVLQQRPACVIKVGETELAVDPEIASDILVVRAETEMPPETLGRWTSDGDTCPTG